MTTVLLLGLKTSVVADAQEKLGLPDVRILTGYNLDDVRKALASTKIDHVVMGAGLDLDTRLAIVQEIYRTTDSTTVHMKDAASGPEGFYPFARGVLTGLDNRGT
ncbi:MAG: hypothetical protein HOQ24_06195 [Mycobacteriaceae bacterium]|nr:hypothetical protein [Mycobacteriaceae bacterium]